MNFTELKCGSWRWWIENGKEYFEGPKKKYTVKTVGDPRYATFLGKSRIQRVLETKGRRRTIFFEIPEAEVP